MTLPDSAAVQAHIAAFEADLQAAGSPRDAQAVRDKYLGRKNGVVASWMQMIGGASPDRRREIGRYANELKQAIEARWIAYEAAVDSRARPPDAVDVTLPGRIPRLGHRHPLTIVRDRMEEIFTRMAFAIVEGPEVEDEWHCFDALNMPAEHPARDMQDTLYLAPPIRGDRDDDLRTLLRTHTSSIQIRYMRTHQPPIRIIAPGRVYRRDDLDLTHTPMFSQVEGLVVDENIGFSDLKGHLQTFLENLLGARTKTRFRPSYFPFTEPSTEVDVKCFFCPGDGCPSCKHTGWIEILGAGVVNPRVLSSVGWDPEKWSGFAFGIGVERVAMLVHGVRDLRDFYTNDLRFLKQFDEDFV